MKMMMNAVRNSIYYLLYLSWKYVQVDRVTYSVHHPFRTYKLYHGVREWQDLLETGKILQRSNSTTTTTTVYSISRGLQIFRLLPRPSATTTAYWRHKERVYFGGLEMGLEKAV